MKKYAGTYLSGGNIRVMLIIRGQLNSLGIDNRLDYLYNLDMKKAEQIQFITDENGDRKSVVLPVETYEEMLEDIQDLVAIAERKNEDSVSFEAVVKKLKVDGLL